MASQTGSGENAMESELVKNCLTLAPQSRSHELLARLRNNFEPEGRTATEGTGPKWDKEKMINVLFCTVSLLLRENANLETQLATFSKAAVEMVARHSPEPPPKNGARKEGKCPESLEKKGKEGGAAKEQAGIYPATPPLEVAPLPMAPPPYYGEEPTNGRLYPTPPPGTPTTPAAAHPIAIVKQVTDPQGVTRTTATYRTRTRAELQELCKESKIKSAETLVIWLDRLVVEYRSKLLDLEEASFLTRQASRNRGHATDLELVVGNTHRNIPIPYLDTGQIDHKSRAEGWSPAA
ncbi:bis(5'-adenosyl)-triphosphatase isoform X2 [Alligator sinensis]|uniref:Bis(5'-adenosyl)-triphosphatase isoform X2 n=1 Tax=Alligator sinensis TaxID=38654 RepID=A0A3Q0G9F4_ALLSI|nr:bis(5'-adenosyl)-triphosphatase isoform X2 [Alligator sinensis]